MSTSIRHEGPGSVPRISSVTGRIIRVGDRLNLLEPGPATEWYFYAVLAYGSPRREDELFLTAGPKKEWDYRANLLALVEAGKRARRFDPDGTIKRMIEGRDADLREALNREVQEQVRADADQLTSLLEAGHVERAGRFTPTSLGSALRLVRRHFGDLGYPIWIPTESYLRVEQRVLATPCELDLFLIERREVSDPRD